VARRKPVDGVKPEELLTTGQQEQKDPPPRGKRSKDKMTDKEFEALVFTQAMDAQNYIDEFVSRQRELSTDYYQGRLPDIDAEDLSEDRSRAVLTDVRDTVHGMMPDLLRIFFGAESVVQYKAVPEDDITLQAKREMEAKQATDYIHHVVLRSDNPDSFSTLHDVFQDALVRKTGFVKYWWEKSRKPIYSTHTGLDEQMVLALASSDDVEITGKRPYPVEDAVLGPRVLYDVQLKRTVDKGRIRIEGVPCEKIIVARRGRSVDNTTLFGYIDNKPASWFVEHGYAETVEELKDVDRDLQQEDKPEAQARRPERSTMVSAADDPSEDPSRRLIKFGEIYITADYDGDGIAELRRVITAGTRFKVLENEPHDEVQYAAFCPYPEAYEFFGESVADLTMDIQRIRSRIMRDVLDSLAQSVTPAMGVVEGKVNIDDVLNPDTSRAIRMQAPGMVQPIVTPFVGKEALPVLDLMSSVREERTGISKASAGLDPDVLQSTTKEAVTATLTRAQARVEMVARIFSETGMRRLFRGILKLLVKHQDQARVVALRGTWVSVDPKSWNADMTAEPNLPLGRGATQEQIQFLAMVAAKQEQLIMQLGPSNPFCSLDHYSYTLRQILQLAGWPNTENFFGDLSKMDPQQKQAWLQQVAAGMAAAKSGGGQGAAHDPATEHAKIASHEKIKAAEIQEKREARIAATQMKGLELHTQLQTEAMRLFAEHHTTMSEAQLNAMVEHAGNRLDAQTKVAIAAMQPEPAPNDNG
jgi:hypothetical protein